MTTENVNVNSFIGHSVVLQYVTVQRVEQIWSAKKTCLSANLTQWRHKYENDYVMSPVATSLTQSCGKHCNQPDLMKVRTPNKNENSW